MTTPLSKKPILRGAIIFLALIGTIFLAFIFRPKPPLYALIDLAKSDRPDKDHLTTVLISTSIEGQKADTIHSSAMTLDEALEKSLEKVTANPDYLKFTHFRLDIFYGGIAANPTKLIDDLPTISDHTYFAGPNIHPKKIYPTPQALTSDQISDIIHKNAIYLANQLDDDGQFVFDRGIFSGDPLSEYYYTSEHAAAISALLRAYSLTDDAYLLRQAEKAIDYLPHLITTLDHNSDQITDDTAGVATIKLSANALTALALYDYQNISGNLQHSDSLAELLPFAEQDLSTLKENEEYLSAIPYWLAVSLKAYQDSAGLNSAKTYTFPAFDTLTPEELYANFQEPWLAMFSDSPASILHSFRANAGCGKTSITDNQSAIFTLINFLATQD